MNDVSIIINNLGKKFSTHKKPHTDFWILKNINLIIDSGHIVGIIGRNGTGKSTLLKMIANIILPTEGTIETYGRCGSMLELGTGFHPEFTGRENIYLSGTILGLRKTEIDNLFESIVKFSGVEKFIDEPLKHYSSGMYVRLAFSVSSHVDADIILIDEVLSVGDTDFQRKCFEKINSLACVGKTFIVVSHDLSVISTLCDRAVVLHQGEMVYDGNPNEAIDFYNSLEKGDLI